MRRLKARKFDDLSSIADSDLTLIQELVEKEKSNPFEFLINRTQNRKNYLENGLLGSGIIEVTENLEKGIPTIDEDIDLANMFQIEQNKSQNNFLNVPQRSKSFGRRQTMDLSIIQEPSNGGDSYSNLDEVKITRRSFLNPNRQGLLVVPEGPSAAERSFNIHNAISKFKEQKNFSQERMSKLVKIAKKIKTYRHKREKRRLNKFKKQFGQEFADRFRKGGNPIYFDEKQNCPMLSRSIGSKSKRKGSKSKSRSKKSRHSKDLKLNRMESGKKRVNLKIDSFDSLFSNQDDKNSQDSDESLSISDLLERKAEERKKRLNKKKKSSKSPKRRLQSAKLKSTAAFHLRRAKSGSIKDRKLKVFDFNKRKGSVGHVKNIQRGQTLKVTRSKKIGNKSVGFTSPESSVKYVERVWSPKSYRDKNSWRKQPPATTHLENQPRMYRPHTAKESRSEVTWKINSKKASFNFLTKQKVTPTQKKSIHYDPQMHVLIDKEHMMSLQNISEAKKKLLRGVTRYLSSTNNLAETEKAIKKIVNKKAPEDKDIHYPGALTKKLKLSKSLDLKDFPKSKTKQKKKPQKKFIRLLKSAKAKKPINHASTMKIKRKSKTSNIYSSSISLLNLRKKHGFFKNSGFNCDGIYQ